MDIYELWRFEEGIGESTYTGVHRWMVWKVGPISGAEEWFKTEEEARTWIAERLGEAGVVGS